MINKTIFILDTGLPIKGTLVTSAKQKENSLLVTLVVPNNRYICLLEYAQKDISYKINDDNVVDHVCVSLHFSPAPTLPEHVHSSSCDVECCGCATLQFAAAARPQLGLANRHHEDSAAAQ